MEPFILERAEHHISRRNIDHNVLKVLYRLINHGFAAYLVGGGVRDMMLGRRPKDFDVGTSAHPHQVRELFRNSRLIGRRFRLVHVFFGPQNVEVATFRRRGEEQAANSDLLIRQDNTFGTAQEDALRRDFTVNALFYDPATFRVIDYVGGLADLGARLIRTVGDPEFRMREDPVRMIRAVRFAARLGFEIESATRDAIERHREDLSKAAVPRLVEEIFRTFGSPSAASALELAQQLGLVEVLLPVLSRFLRFSPEPVRETRTCRNLAAMGRAVESGVEPTHELVLSCLFVDQQLAGDFEPSRASSRVAAVLTELRGRGFARGDTERMRLLIDAFARMIRPGHRTHNLLRRPYFPEARGFYEIIAPNYPHDAGALARILAAREALGAPHGSAPRCRARRRRRRRRWRPRLQTANAAKPDETRHHAGASGAHPPRAETAAGRSSPT